MNQRALETLINLIWQSGNVQRSPIDSDPTARLERQQQIRRKRLQIGKVDVAGRETYFISKGNSTLHGKGTPLLACLNARENTPTKLANQRERRRRRCECEPKAALTLPAPPSLSLSICLSLSPIVTLLKCDPLAKCRFVIGAFSVDKTNDVARRATFFSCLALSSC